MGEVTAIASYGDVTRALSVSDLRSHVDLVHDVMRQIMKAGQDYDTIPGTVKPTLLQPGAQKLCLAFGFAPAYQVILREYGEHREYEVRCTMTHRQSGVTVGEGVGTATTLESKYRYRWENTGKQVPKDYWNTRDPELLGGPSFAPRKIKGTWYIFQRIAHSDPADYWNTCLKMAKKRAYVDATITATGAGHILQQDVDDPDGIPPESEPEDDTAPATPPRSKSGAKEEAPADHATANEPLTPGQVKILRAKMSNGELTDADFQTKFGCAPEALPRGKINEALEWTADPTK